jgi:hypothetical protein
MAYNRADMNRKKREEIAVSDFTTFLYQKGYRGRFSVEIPAIGKTLFAGKLSDCLRDVLLQYYGTSHNGSTIELKTTAPYTDNLECTFSLRLDEVRGFLITGAAYRDTETGRTHAYRLSTNHQLPGANSIAGLFPKPKPWDKHRKGNFRP